ncbi:FKBP-type peptidyl-prolyl cis-trans isomerase [Shewanella sp. D64]|uniref:FKBP-type peptidyl-prolyl cis-trans isomerase n=1 Tax=unclassified Shewanella TaxID=196818 RepID=UPI0022BA23F4|nr:MULTISPECIES: FKBP-type peptidyl-prolyl cis-trans isomerase [unclassified Shewanella]MEC4728021.1 FKBP-type peptidyl-prolyl cis-trans isomerase [Shewanella sp. D64]MEC4740134.1 FKBP-type peptidyl-prolyl cis-trans isomerase [Shewanella sp. E94]WBJ95196.1 FKBP-type peptidyl-prolyl cis-trans isomerase [Shewanella sp. MTB7]
MKNFTRNTLAVVTSLTLFISANSMASTEITTDIQKESYSIGASLGKYISGQIYSQTELGAEVDVELVIQGVVDALKNNSQFSDEEVLTFLNQRAKQLNTAREIAEAKMTLANVIAGNTYLAENKKKNGVNETASGLQYEIVSEGEGRKPNAQDVVTVHYKGFLVDGTPFDDSYERNEPNRFALMSVIEGWQEGIPLMTEGSTYKFSIPAALAYGEKQVGIIPPSSTLIFEVELVKVEAPGENSHGMGLSGMGMGGMMGQSNSH